MSPGPTFERVYLALKTQLASARFAPGEHLDPSHLGDELGASITPVRDALHRLVGERLVEAPRNDGFRVPAPTEAQLRDLYGWNRELLEVALRRVAAARAATVSQLGGQEPECLMDVKGPAGLFKAIAVASGNSEHEATIISLNDRLAALRVSEERLFKDWEAELDGLRRSHAEGDLRELRRAISSYHRRRQRSVPDLLLEWRRIAAQA